MRVFLPFGVKVSFIFLQGYRKLWISEGKKLWRTEIAYLLSSFLWDFKIQILIIITWSMVKRYVTAIFLSWLKPIFSHFLKLISLLTDVVLGKVIPKIYSKFKGEHPRRSVILIKLHATLLKSHFGVDFLL